MRGQLARDALELPALSGQESRSARFRFRVNSTLRRDTGRDVVAHQSSWRLSDIRMGSELGGRQREDQPAAAGVDRGERQDVTQEVADTFSVLRER